MTEEGLATAKAHERLELDAQAQKLRDAVQHMLAQEPLTLATVISVRQVLDVLQDVLVKKEYLL